MLKAIIIAKWPYTIEKYYWIYYEAFWFGSFYYYESEVSHVFLVFFKLIAESFCI